jgi:hypothetical protein
MNSINLVGVDLISRGDFGHSTRDVLFLASTAWLLIFTSEMALRASLTSLYYSGISGDLSLLPLVGRFCVVVRYMPLE